MARIGNRESFTVSMSIETYDRIGKRAKSIVPKRSLSNVIEELVLEGLEAVERRESVRQFSTPVPSGFQDIPTAFDDAAERIGVRFDPGPEGSDPVPHFEETENARFLREHLEEIASRTADILEEREKKKEN